MKACFWQLFFFTLFVSQSTMAQDATIDTEIKLIDSLIYYNQFQLAENKVDSVYALFQDSRSKKHRAQQLELRYRKTLIIDNQFEHVDALPIFMDVLQASEKNKLYELACKTTIRIAFNQEKATNYHLAYQYLHAALKLSEKHHLPEWKSTIYIRYSLIHRFLGEAEEHFTLDSAFYYAEKAIDYAKKGITMRTTSMRAT